MASSPTPVHPARYLTLFLVLLIGVYLLVFLTGDKQARPKLGIDLQGGTRVTLTARTPDGSRPTQEALNQAQQIISSRVNGLGVSGSEVVIDGDNLVIGDSGFLFELPSTTSNSSIASTPTYSSAASARDAICSAAACSAGVAPGAGASESRKMPSR